MSFDDIIGDMGRDLRPAYKIRICYKRVRGEYELSTIDSRALDLRIGEWSLHPEQYWTTSIKKLPRIPSVHWVKYRVKYATKRDQKFLDSQYAELLQLRKEADRIQSLLMKKEDSFVRNLKERGLALKPAAPEDIQLLLPSHSTRVQNQVAMMKSFDMDAVIQLSKRHTQLKKCVYKVTSYRVDKAQLNQMMRNMNADLVNKFYKLNPVYRFMEIELARPECHQCGGKVLKGTGVCKRCGYAHVVNPSQTQKRSKAAA